eukprot:13204314-Alexandrium_andersonii.AAC.1
MTGTSGPQWPWQKSKGTLHAGRPGLGGSAALARLRCPVAQRVGARDLALVGLGGGGGRCGLVGGQQRWPH